MMESRRWSIVIVVTLCLILLANLDYVINVHNDAPNDSVTLVQKKRRSPSYSSPDKEEDRRGFNCTSANKDPSDWKSHITFGIIGVQKGGTTFLHSVLSQHPLVRPSRQKEIHCFDYNWNPKDPECKSGFKIQQLQSNPRSVSFDASPSYIWNTETVIPRFLHAFPCLKFLVLLRNPIDRYYSQHNMMVKYVRHRQPPSFHDRVLTGMEHLLAAGLLPHWQFNDVLSSSQSNPNRTLADYAAATIDLDIFERFHGSKEEIKAWKVLLKRGSVPPRCAGGVSALLKAPCVDVIETINSVSISRGLYSIMLSRWLQFFPSERILTLKFDDFQNTVGLNKTLAKIYQFINLPHRDYKLDNEHAKPPYSREKVGEVAYDVLQKLYAPYTEKLQSVLGDDWKNPW